MTTKLTARPAIATNFKELFMSHLEHDQISKANRIRGYNRSTSGQLRPSICCVRTPILEVADLFHPFNLFPVERFLNRDVTHSTGCRGAVPMFLVGRKPHYVAGYDFFNPATFALRPASAG